MAGTRLLISLTALIQVVGIIVMAIYAGLCQKDDLLCRPFQRSQATLALPPPLAQTTLDMPPLIVATADSQVVFWKQIVNAVKLLDDDQVTVQAVANAKLLEQVCRQGDTDDATGATSATGVDIYICETNEPRSTAQLKVKDAVSIFYPRSLRLRHEDWQRLYPPQTNPSRRQLEWTLQLASDIEQEDFDSMVQAANTWWQAHHAHGSWPCLLQRPVLRVQVAPEAWEASLREIVETTTSTTSLDENDATTKTTRWEMPLDSLDRLLLPPAHREKNRLVSILHVTQKPLQFVDHEGEQSTFASAGATRVAILDINGNLDAVLTRLYQSTFLHCMGHDEEEANAELVSSDSSNNNIYPSWLIKLWYQRTLRQLYSQAVETVHQTHQQLVHPPSWKMTIPAALVDQYNEAVDLLEQCQGLVKEELYAQALDHLDRAITLLERIGKSPDLLEPLDFPPEQYAAILAPLALPLLLPLLKGTFTEVMRYRRLRRAKLV